MAGLNISGKNRYFKFAPSVIALLTQGIKNLFIAKNYTATK